jgi:hypothetical protein
VTFEEAGRHTLSFGKHAGDTVDEVAENDKGLEYLDWCRGQGWMKAKTKRADREAIETYLEYPPIARELERVLGA